MDYVLPSSESEVASIVSSANAAGVRVKIAGAGHSFAPIAMTNYSSAGHGLGAAARMLSLDLMAAVGDVQRHVDGKYSHVTVGAGIRLHDLNDKVRVCRPGRG